MRKTCKLLTLLLAIGIFCGSHAQGSKVKVSESEQRKLSEFMSNFVEPPLPNFDLTHPLTQTQILKFIVDRRRRMGYFETNGKTIHLTITKKYILEMASKFFDVNLQWDKLPSNLVSKKALSLTLEPGEGEATYSATFKSLVKTGDLYKIEVDLWEEPGGEGGDIFGSATGTLKKSKSGWKLVSYLAKYKK